MRGAIMVDGDNLGIQVLKSFDGARPNYPEIYKALSKRYDLIHASVYLSSFPFPFQQIYREEVVLMRKRTKFRFKDIAGVLEQAQFLILDGLLLLGSFYEGGQRYLDLLPTPKGAADLAEFFIQRGETEAIEALSHRALLASQNQENGPVLQGAFRLAGEILEAYLKRIN